MGRFAAHEQGRTRHGRDHPRGALHARPRRPRRARPPGRWPRLRAPPRAALRDRDQPDPDVRDRAVRDDPADGRRARRPAGGVRVDLRRAARARRRPRMGRARRGDGGRGRDVPLPPRRLPVPHRPPHAVPVRLDGDAHHSADHVDGRHRDRPVPRVPRPGDDIARDAPDLAGDRRARAVRPLSADRVDRRDHDGALERRVPVRRHGHRRVADPLRPEPRVHLSEGRVSRSAGPSGRAWAPGC